MEHVLDMSMTAALFDHSDACCQARTRHGVFSTLNDPAERTLHSLAFQVLGQATCVESGIEAA